MPSDSSCFGKVTDCSVFCFLPYPLSSDLCEPSDLILIFGLCSKACLQSLRSLQSNSPVVFFLGSTTCSNLNRVQEGWWPP